MTEKILIVEDQFVEADYIRVMLTKAGYSVMDIAHSVAEAKDIIENETPDFVLLDIFLQGKETGIDLARELAKENIAFVYLSASSDEEVLGLAKATQPYGFVVKPFREKDLLITLEIARYRHEHSMEAALRRENVLKEKLSSIIKKSGEWQGKLLHICRTFQSYISFDYAAIGLNTIKNISSQAVSFLRIGYEEYQQIGVPELLTISGLTVNELASLANNTAFDTNPAIVPEKMFQRKAGQSTLHSLFGDLFQIKSCMTLPLTFSTGEVFIFCFYSRKTAAYSTDQTELLDRLQKLITNSIEFVFSEAKASRPGISQKAETIKVTTQGFEGIIGKSHLLLNIFNLITQVAPSDTSVLILGESGTGKERIAECVHNLSPRKNNSFVKVNCATLPSGLIESELFGHEKGSFTGATDKRIGKFEKADKGTIFLDEIGEMPLDLQVKLLRVLQEKYIERIGSKDETKVDVRIIAATNRNLEKEVAEGRFRLDLYYRLNVFPIPLPALRERIDDIPFLVDHFVRQYNNKTGKQINGVSDKVIKTLSAYRWPGNIRELENVIERSVLLTTGSIIEDVSIPTTTAKENIPASEELRMKTIYENERDYIVKVLRKCNGKIQGAGGAAEILNIPPTTLKSRMIKLGIQRKDVE